jgi:hypothetical protein
MSILSSEAAPTSGASADILAQASAILAREVARLARGMWGRDEIAHAMDDTLTRPKHNEADAYQEHIPLVGCSAPAQAGGEASTTMAVANEESTPSDVTLYCTNFVADSGHEIPSLRVAISPRMITIPAKGQATFEIKVAVPQQTPAGIYSGLIQAMGSRYVKAVLSVEVL